MDKVPTKLVKNDVDHWVRHRKSNQHKRKA
jgi:hypothetical protein